MLPIPKVPAYRRSRQSDSASPGIEISPPAALPMIPGGHWRTALTLLGCSLFGSAAAADASDLAQLLESLRCNGCDLRGADLSGRHLLGSEMKWADLRGADLSRADLSGAKLIGARLDDAELSGAKLQGATLEGASLRGVALHEVSLIGADLRWTDLSHLDADRDLEFVGLVGVALEGARFKHGVRCGGFPAKGGWGCKAAGSK